MSGIGIKEGVRAPLFDRLSETPETKSGRRGKPGVLDRAGQRESLQRELSRLLNTRSAYKAGKNVKEVRTVVDYGLPDYSAMYTQSREDQKKLAALIKGTVEAYEPRLSQINVEAQVLGNSEKALLVNVSGALANGRLMERVTFAIQVTDEDPRGSGLGG